MDWLLVHCENRGMFRHSCHETGGVGFCVCEYLVHIIKRMLRAFFACCTMYRGGEVGAGRWAAPLGFKQISSLGCKIFIVSSRMSSSSSSFSSSLRIQCTSRTQAWSQLLRRGSETVGLRQDQGRHGRQSFVLCPSHSGPMPLQTRTGVPDLNLKRFKQTQPRMPDDGHGHLREIKPIQPKQLRRLPHVCITRPHGACPPPFSCGGRAAFSKQQQCGGVPSR